MKSYSAVAKLQVRKNAVSKFCKARTVPFAIKEAVNEEWNHLLSCGIRKPVTYSDWAAPIVVIPKKKKDLECAETTKSLSNKLWR